MTTTSSDLPGPVASAVTELLAEPATDAATFWGRRFDLGLAWVQFPPGRGGLGVDSGWQPQVDAALAVAGHSGPSTRNQIGVGLVAPTLLDHADPDLLDRLLRPCFTAEEVWCQLFSEPGAGSDLANLSTAARRTGDGGWVVSGEKMWTSYARSARRGLLLARTDPAVPKHRGLTCFVVDMQAAGVTVEPIKQINGYARVNMVHLDAVEVPDSARVGEVGAGWAVALTALGHERRMLGAKGQERSGQSPAERALELWGSNGRPAEYVDDVVRLWVRSELIRLTSQSAGSGAAVGKLLAAELERDGYDLMMDLLGAQALTYPGYDDLVDADYARLEYVDPRSAYLSSRRSTIAGGTSEIMRDVLAERVLGLPPEPRVDKDVAWNRTLRG